MDVYYDFVPRWKRGLKDDLRKGVRYTGEKADLDLKNDDKMTLNLDGAEYLNKKFISNDEKRSLISYSCSHIAIHIACVSRKDPHWVTLAPRVGLPGGGLIAVSSFEVAHARYACFFLSD